MIDMHEIEKEDLPVEMSYFLFCEGIHAHNTAKGPQNAPVLTRLSFSFVDVVIDD